MKRRRRAKVVTSLTLVCILVASGVAYLVLFDDGVDCGSFRFDREKWSTPGATKAKDGDDSPRQQIVDGLRQCGTIDGADEATVRRLLGRSQSSARDSTFRYTIGPDRRSGGFLAVDDEVLLVEFDTSGKVEALTTIVP